MGIVFQRLRFFVENFVFNYSLVGSVGTKGMAKMWRQFFFLGREVGDLLEQINPFEVGPCGFQVAAGEGGWYLLFLCGNRLRHCQQYIVREQRDNGELCSVNHK